MTKVRAIGLEVINCVAEEGEQVTCENGHPICVVAETILPGSSLMAAQFKDWSPDYPDKDRASGTRVKPCHCGAEFLRSSPVRVFALHLSTGWRTSQSVAADTSDSS